MSYLSPLMYIWASSTAGEWIAGAVFASRARETGTCKFPTSVVVAVAEAGHFFYELGIVFGAVGVPGLRFLDASVVSSVDGRLERLYHEATVAETVAVLRTWVDDLPVDFGRLVPADDGEVGIFAVVPESGAKGQMVIGGGRSDSLLLVLS